MKLRTLFLLSALTLTAPALALADNAPVNPNRPDHPSAAVLQHLADGRIAFIETALNLSGDQQKLWQPVADLLRQQSADHAHGGMWGDHKPGDHAQSSLSDMLSHQSDMMTKRADHAQKLAAALKPLEASLTAEQKETLKIAFFTSMPHPSHHRGPGSFDPAHGKAVPPSPDGAPSGDGSQPG